MAIKNKKKTEFYKNKKIFSVDDTDVNKKNHIAKIIKLLVYFIGYNDNDVIRPIYLKLSKMTGYINEFNENNVS